MLFYKSDLKYDKKNGICKKDSVNFMCVTD